MGEYTTQLASVKSSNTHLHLPPAARNVRLFFEETRPCVQAIFLIRFLAGALTAGGERTPGWAVHLIGPGAAWFLATLFAYGINGVTDVAEDRVNRTGRPIARGDLSPRVAAYLTWLSGTGALAIALLHGDGRLVGYVLAYLLLGYAYSARPFQLKCTTLGAAGSVLLMGLLTYAAGWAAAGVDRPSGAAVVLAVAMSLWMCVVGAVTKDFSHARGDAAAGRRTSVTAWGAGTARTVAAVGALTVATGFVTAAVRWQLLLVPAAVLLAGACTVAVLCWTTRNDERRGRTPYRAFMVSQHLGHAGLLASLAT